MIAPGYYYDTYNNLFVKTSERSMFTLNVKMGDNEWLWYFHEHTTWRTKPKFWLKHGGVAYKKFIKSDKGPDSKYLKAFESIHKKETVHLTKLGREIL